ncbi:MAG: hypothetical protein CMQ41_13350 [Gammaproteobacteria bacterium]|nr:hypothetical protein [Gammaproteobacteria bacterium]
MALTHFAYDSELKDMLVSIEADGAIIIDNLATPESMDQIARELAPWLGKPVSESPMINDKFRGFQTLRTSGLIGKSTVAGQLALDPTIAKIIDSILGPQCADYQLSWTQAIKIGPGEVAQLPHRDTYMYPFKRPGPECFINTIWAQSDFTRENGATRIYQGSHRWPDNRTPTEDDRYAFAEMPKGSVIVFLGSTYHGGGRNETIDSFRVGIGLAYTLGWLRQEENQYLAVPIEKARALSAELQRLIGYRVHDRYIGWYEGMDENLFRVVTRKNYQTELRGNALHDDNDPDKKKA